MKAMSTTIETTKHTPGPWRFDRCEYGTDLTYHIQTVDTSHENTFIGEAGGGLQNHLEIRANAKLIAASPDLLDALTLAVNDNGQTMQPEVFKKAIEAIKKATL